MAVRYGLGWKHATTIDDAAVGLQDRPAREVVQSRQVSASGIHRRVGLEKWLSDVPAIGSEAMRFGDSLLVEAGNTSVGIAHPRGKQDVLLEIPLPPLRSDDVDHHRGNVVAEIRVHEIVRRPTLRERNQLWPASLRDRPGKGGAG